MAVPAYDVVLLAGGSASRFGRDKLAVPVGGRPMLDRALSAALGARRVVVVGPIRRTDVRPDDMIWTREHPPGSGPLAGLAAGLGCCSEELVVVLAADMPLLDQAVVERLVGELDAAETTVDVVALVDGSGRTQPLAAAYRRPAVLAALAGIGEPAGLGMFRLLDRLRLATVPDPGAAADCDTPQDLEQIEERIEERMRRRC